MAWLRYVQRSHRDRTTRRVKEWKPTDRRLRGQPRKCRMDEEDVEVLLTIGQDGILSYRKGL